MKKGFTIIELIVVIAIIAVLAGIVLVGVTQYINKSKGVAFRASVDGFIKAVALKKSNGEALPTERIATYNPDDGWATSSAKTVFDNNFKNYISDFPKPPFPGGLTYWIYSDPLLLCAGSPYMLLVSGAQNKVFFSDWITWYYSDYKCYPL